MIKKPIKFEVKMKTLSDAERKTLAAELNGKRTDLREYIRTTKNTAIAFKLVKENAACLKTTMI